MDTNCRAMDRDCKEIDLIRGSFLPLKNIEREREREREREKQSIGLFFNDI